MSPNLPPEVAPLIEELTAGIRDALGENIVGVYLRGSLALGGFDPSTSDVDLLVVTERPVSEVEGEALEALHNRIPPTNADGAGRRYEVSYIDRAAIRRFGPSQRLHPRSGDEAPFEWYAHRDNFVLERWTVRERGVTLLGPDPKTLIDLVSTEEIRAAVASELRIRIVDWAGSAGPAPVWLQHRRRPGIRGGDGLPCPPHAGDGRASHEGGGRNLGSRFAAGQLAATYRVVAEVPGRPDARRDANRRDPGVRALGSG